jgi:translation initiation factor eIF-2B subunit gamma
VIIVIQKHQKNQIVKYINEIYKGKIQPIIEIVDDDTDTMDALRKIQPRIKTDFIVMSVDLITNFNLIDLVNVHRKYSSSLTMLLTEKSQKSKEKLDRMEMNHYVGVDANERERIQYFVSDAELDSALKLTKSFAKRCPNMILSTKYDDPHLYIFAHWVIDLIAKKENMISIKHELVPYIVKKQYRNVKEESGFPVNKLRDIHEDALKISSHGHNENDKIRCYAYFLKEDQAYCKRAYTLNSYFEINRQVAKGTMYPIENVTEQYSGKQVLVGQDCLIGTGFQPGEKVTVKLGSIIGNHVKVGNNVKIGSSLIMDHVTISDGCVFQKKITYCRCTIQNSIIATDVYIQPNTTLTNCHIEKSMTIASGDYKNEVLAKHTEEF